MRRNKVSRKRQERMKILIILIEMKKDKKYPS